MTSSIPANRDRVGTRFDAYSTKGKKVRENSFFFDCFVIVLSTRIQLSPFSFLKFLLRLSQENSHLDLASNLRLESLFSFFFR